VKSSLFLCAVLTEFHPTRRLGAGAEPTREAYLAVAAFTHVATSDVCLHELASGQMSHDTGNAH